MVERAAQAVILKDEIDILYTALNKLTQAANPAEQLEAVSDYARANGATSGVLLYVDNDDAGQPEAQEIVAEWVKNGTPTRIGSRFPASEQFRWMNTKDQPIFVNDNLTDEMVPLEGRERLLRQGVRATVIMPLTVKGRFVGVLSFNWDAPHPFDARDQRIYTALIQQAAPVIDSVRLFEQTQRRAQEVERAKYETDILYAAFNRLARASAPQEILEAVSDYPQANGAVHGSLIFFTGSYTPDDPLVGERVAEWVLAGGKPQGLGQRLYRYGIDEISLRWLSHPDQPILATDVPNDERFHQSVRQDFIDYERQSIAILPLNNRGRWVGMILFSWNVPYEFTTRDQRIYTALIQQAAPVIDSIRLFEQNRERAARAEYLLKINMALSRAANEMDILSAIALYTAGQGAEGMTLNYFDMDDYDRPMHSYTVALWKDGKVEQYDSGRHRIVPLVDYGYAALWYDQPDEVLLIENIATDARLDEQHREAMLANMQSRAMATLPLHSGGRYVGIVTIMWFAPHVFSENERYIYSALLRTLPSVVATRRAYLAEEEARQESEFLYQMSEAVNAAVTYEEVLQAVARLDSGSQAVFLTVWDNYDYNNADKLQVVAAIGANGQPLPLHSYRFPKAAFPITEVMSHDSIWVIEDIMDDPRVDPVTAATWTRVSTRALIGTPLWSNNRWMGGLTFHSNIPRKYTARDRRLTVGIGDLVLAAFERIRLQAETEQERRQAEMLARINAALSQAADEQAILAPVADLAEQYGAALSILSYTDDPQTVNIVAMRAGHGRTPLPMSFLPITSFPVSDYPVLHLAYTHPDEPIFISDVQHDARVTGQQNQDFLRSVGWAAIVVIPLKTVEQWQGVLTFAWDQPQVFNDELRALFKAIRPTVASVVTSRRAYVAEEEARRETEQRARELETVAKVSAAAATSLNEHELLETVSYLTAISFRQYHLFVYLLEEERLVRATGAPQSSHHPLPQVISLNSESSLVAQAARTRQGIIVNDIANTTSFKLRPMLPGAKSEMAVPMVARDQLLGVLDVQSPEADHFSDADIRVMSVLADLIAVALQNARLYHQGQELAALEERNRLARELHDSVSQAIYGIALGARTARALLERDPSRLAEPLDYVLSLAEAGLTEMRALIFDLRPESLENEGLVTALTKQAASLQARHGIQVQIELGEEPALPLEVKEMLYRIAREALHNTVKHAQATQIMLQMQHKPDCIELEIADNGIGFDTSGEFPGHLGLQSMRERAARLNGTLAIESRVGTGTRIAIQVPVGNRRR